jgi:non-heme chloroperoxidase
MLLNFAKDSMSNHKLWRGTAALWTVAMISFFSAGTTIAENVQVSDDLTLYYEVAGSGDKTILFVPGWGMSSAVFEKQFEEFEGSDEYRAISYDPRGQGQSSKTEGGHFYDQRGADLHAFIEALNLNNITLVGWSYGTLDQFAYISQFGTDKLDGAVIVDGTVKTVGEDNTKEWVWYSKNDADGYRQWYTMTPLTDRKGFNTAFAEWMLEGASAENVEWISNIANQTSDTTMAILNETASYADYSETLHSIEGQLPLLLVMREEWKDIVSNHAAENLPSANVVAFGKHMMFWDQPEAFNNELKAFLNSQ